MKRTAIFVFALMMAFAASAQGVWSSAVEKVKNNKTFSSAAAAVLLDSVGVSVTDNGVTYPVGLFGGAGYTAMTVEYMKSVSLPMDMPQKMLASLDAMEREPVAVHLGNHPANNKTLQKRERQLQEGGNPFVDPDSWKLFLAELREKTLEIIQENEKKLLEHGETV